MDFNTTLRWLSIAGSLALLLRWRTLFTQRHSLGWAAVAAGILAVNAIGAFLFPETAGLIAGGLWIALVLTPSLLTRAVLGNVARGRFDRASLLARLVCILHPADTWPQQPALYGALALAQRGETDRAAAILRGLIARPSIPQKVEQSARTYLYRMLGQWEELLVWLQSTPGRNAAPEAVSISELTLLGMRLRALGETGRLSEMLAAYQAGFLQMEHYAGANAAAQCLLFVFAFAGREAALARLLGGALAQLPPEMKRFWQATARIAAGQPAAARAELRALSAVTVDASLRAAVERRLAHDLPAAAATFSRAETLTLDFIESGIERDAPFQLQEADGLRRAYVTLTLIALNVSAYGAELASGGGENMEVLFRLGALWARAVVDEGQWQRLVSAMFLHYGIVHLGMNMIGLAIIGPWVERRMGRVRYAVVYLAGGIGSMAAVVWFIRRGWMPEELLVGASGAIMGLIGAYAALLALGWRRERSSLAARRLRGVALIVVAQIVFDVTNPQVSFAAHMSGLACGALLTALLMLVRRPVNG